MQLFLKIKFIGGAALNKKEKGYHKLKKSMLLILSVIIVFSLLVNSVYASEVGKSSYTLDDKISSEIQSNINRAKAFNNGKGLIPYKVKIKKNASIFNSAPLLKASASLPSSYDLRKFGRTTSVKNQGEINDCWAFSAIGSLESNLLRIDKKAYDFSEINMATHNGIYDDPYIGGNNQIAAAYLASWRGPVNESNDPYPTDYNNIIIRNGLSSVKHVQEVLFIPDRTNFLDNSDIKRSIINYGAVASSIHMDEDRYYNSSKNSYYNNKYTSTDHAVDIVGWDDNYSKDNFLIKPKGNGAFICKNSWGTGFGDNGYFYVSYYDLCIGTDNAVFNGIEPSNNYSKNYQYDLSYNGIVSFGENNWFSNVFTASSNSSSTESLAAVSFYTDKANASYSVYLETDYDSNKFKKITSNLLLSGTVSMPGYHTIKLPKSIELKSGKKFAVAVKVKGASIPLDYLNNPNGNSFIGTDGLKWAAIPAAVNLKAFTNITPKVSVKDISLSSSSINMNVDAVTKLISYVSPSNAANKNVSWSSSNSKVAMVDTSGNVKGISPGTAVITVKSQDGNFAAKCTVNVKGTLNIKSVSFGTIPINVNSDLILTFPSSIYKGVNFKYITLKDSNSISISMNATINNNILILKPKTNLKNNGMYFINIPVNSIVDVKNNTLPKDYSINFVTVSSYNFAVKFSDINLEKKIRVILKKPKGNITSKDMENLMYFDISKSNIVSLNGLEYAVKLTSINAKDNKIKDVTPLKNLLALKTLDIRGNVVKDLVPLKNLNGLDIIK